MYKVLKIGGIAIVGIIILVLGISFFSKLFSENKNVFKSNSASYSSPSGTSLPSRSVGLSNIMDSAVSEKMGSSSLAPSSGIEQSQDLISVDKKIIKSGNLNLKVDSADEAAEEISEVAKNNGGEIFASNFYQSQKNIKSGTVTVKVPMKNFETTFAELKKIASLVIRESTAGQDVTEQYVDLQAQLKNRQAEEQTFIRILDRAQIIEDVLAVTRELARVRGNIEQLQGRIKYLESQTDMSTIAVDLTEDANITVVDSWRPWQIVKESFNALLKGLQGFVDFLIRLLIVIIPLLLLWVLILWLIYRVGKKIYLKIKNREQIN